MKQRTQTDRNVGNGWRGTSGSQAELAGKAAGHQPEGNRVELSVGCGQLVKTKMKHKEVLKSQSQARQNLKLKLLLKQ